MLSGGVLGYKLPYLFINPAPIQMNVQYWKYTIDVDGDLSESHRLKGTLLLFSNPGDAHVTWKYEGHWLSCEGCYFYFFLAGLLC